MKALIYQGNNTFSLQDRPRPTILFPSDAIIKVTKATICGTDLHIIKGDVPSCQPGRVLGHEGVGIVDSVGVSVTRFKKGDRVLLSAISNCATCEYCRRNMYSHCTTGGWILGHTVDGTQAEYVRIPHAESSLHLIPPGVDEASLVLLSDIFPTALECGVQNGRVQPGSTVAIVGPGPVGLAALITAQMYSPSKIIMIGTNAKRLEVAKQLGANVTINIKDGDVVSKVQDLTEGKGCDTVIEAAGVPEAFELTQDLVAPGGVIASVGVHGTKADLHLQNLWNRNITITTRLIDSVSTPMLLKQIATGKLQLHSDKLITHRYKLDDIETAYKTFSQARETGALKVVIDMESTTSN
ncbi:Alcohol dehydrogenase [Cladobotryum mycophilum]|uniref:Alcohol dehydrogenase n=1 Tax=Cladobotryum mycophilum TaxID=491253 RepID=A0ABR0SW73_9HYPO